MGGQAGFVFRAVCRYVAGVWSADVPGLPGVRLQCAHLEDLHRRLPSVIADELGVDPGMFVVRFELVDDGQGRGEGQGWGEGQG